MGNRCSHLFSSYFTLPFCVKLINMEFNFKGLVAAPFTPMQANGDIDTSKVSEYAKHLGTNGVKAVFVNGTTGEGVLSLSIAERKTMLEAWVAEGKDHCPVIMAQVSGCGYREALDLAGHAESLGVSAIGCLPNLFPKPRNVDELVDWCKNIAQAAPETPFFYYHIPGFSGVNLSMTEFLTKGAHVIPTLAGIKYSSAEFGELASMLTVKNRNGKPFKIFHGNDETFVPALTMGIDSAVGSTYNFMPQVFQKLVRLQEEGKKEELEIMQDEITNMFKTIFRFGFAVGALKPVMKIISGLDLGPTRYPYKKMESKDEEELKQLLMNVKLDLFK